MARPATTTILGLSPREAVADALQRCVLGLDSNNRALFESAIVKDESVTMSMRGHTIRGWSQLNPLLEKIFNLHTTHFVTNIRVDLKDNAATTASLTAHAQAYHVPPNTAFTVENTSYTAGTLYYIDLIKDEADRGLWKIQHWTVETNWTYGDRAVITG